ncbi:protein kinase domain-containing protein [Synechococcus sp. CBW1107]|uniref:protein kinase domain-containing protein n=1 Tax=Synechococcus sp. CBW1107 TaxID=2789857 RepID=UPI002AD40119|nr:hypothetical protein [Synechococcus sp. CBW1107]CAK6695422.1 hypothetical protein ICNINCKA_01820 [Synechococcus sp. CBW1107]
MARTFLTDKGESLSLQLTAGSLLGAGGQGQVHTARLGGEVMAVKLMRQIDVDKLRALNKLEARCGAVTTLPRRLLYENEGGRPGCLAGYAMRLVDRNRSVSAARLFNFEQIRHLPHYTWADAVLAALRLAESVATLHRHGVVIGDLNPENVLFEAATTLADTASWRAIVLDTDSFQIKEVGGRHHHCPVSRPLYTAPELIGCDFSHSWRQVSADDFSLAVLIYQLLLHDHPYDNAINDSEPDLAVAAKISRGLYPHAAMPTLGLRASPFRPAPSQISEAIDQAFRRSFSAHANRRTPGLRPFAVEWVGLLRELHGQVVPCRKCRHHHHPRGRECLWCGVDERSGQAISRFPNALPHSGSTSSAPPAVAEATSPPAAAAGSLLHRYGGLHRQLLAHQQRCRWLVGLRAELAAKLLTLERALAELHAQHGDAALWIDRTALERRLSSKASWLRRHVLGRGGSDAQRQESLGRLLQFVDEAVKTFLVFLDWVQSRHEHLLERLAALDLTPLDHGSDPAAAALALLQSAVEQQQEAWLTRQLEQEMIRSWRIEGFGARRLELLEAHGLLHAEHLRRGIDRLTVIPGIGKGLQDKLEVHLAAVMADHRWQLKDRTWPLGVEDLIDLAGFARLAALEEELQVLGKQLKRADQYLVKLNEQVARNTAERDQLLNAFLAIS